MGHRLPFHDGLCKNLHGHSYEAHIILTGEPDHHGMVMDYFDVSSMVRPLIDRLDHCFLVDTSDTEMMDFFRDHPMKVVEFNEPTTAENIAKYLLQHVTQQLPTPHSLTAIKVRVYETAKTYAEVESHL